MQDRIREIIKTGYFCEIHLRKNKNEIRTYQSRVEYVESSDLIYVHIPTFKTKMVKLPQDSKYDVLFKTESNMIKFNMTILGYSKLDGILYMKIKLTSEGEKVQRRKYFRLDLNHNIYLRNISPESSSDELFIADIKDISAGGMRFVSAIDYRGDSDFIVYFMLDVDFYCLEVRVISGKDISEYSGKFKIEYRAEFAQIANFDRDRLVSHIFEVQRNKISRTYGGK